MAVHEETAASPDWGDRVTPDVLVAIKDKKLLPIVQLDRGFVRPSYPGQVIISYFQAGRICDFINEKFGYAKLLDMMHAFGARKSTEQVVTELLAMKPEEFDKQFLAWLDEDLGKTVASFDEWRKKLRAIATAAKESKHDEVIKEGEAVIAMYPDYVEAANAYEFVADAHLAKNNKPAAIKILEHYAKIGGRDPEVLKKLASLLDESGQKGAAAATLAKINYVYPVNDEGLHRKLGDLLFADANYAGAVREYRALVASKPQDTAAAHFNLARAYSALNKDAEVEEHLLQALEAAPGYRPAQKLLLELNAKKKAGGASAPEHKK
jgi:tetratricopeptide (TPR) repeat protein